MGRNARIRRGVAGLLYLASLLVGCARTATVAPAPHDAAPQPPAQPPVPPPVAEETPLLRGLREHMRTQAASLARSTKARLRLSELLVLPAAGCAWLDDRTVLCSVVAPRAGTRRLVAISTDGPLRGLGVVTDDTAPLWRRAHCLNVGGKAYIPCVGRHLPVRAVLAITPDLSAARPQKASRDLLRRLRILGTPAPADENHLPPGPLYLMDGSGHRLVTLWRAPDWWLVAPWYGDCAETATGYLATAHVVSRRADLRGMTEEPPTDLAVIETRRDAEPRVAIVPRPESVLKPLLGGRGWSLVTIHASAVRPPDVIYLTCERAETGDEAAYLYTLHLRHPNGDDVLLDETATYCRERGDEHVLSCEGDGTIVEASYRHGRSANWITEPAVSPDGKQVVYADGNGLFVLTLPE